MLFRAGEITDISCRHRLLPQSTRYNVFLYIVPQLKTLDSKPSRGTSCPGSRATCPSFSQEKGRAQSLVAYRFYETESDRDYGTPEIMQITETGNIEFPFVACR